jgi:hypothetical protein
MQHEHAYTCLKTLAFPPAERIWTLEPGFQCGTANRGKSAISRSVLLFSLSFFFAAALFCFTFASVKKARVPPLGFVYIHVTQHCLTITFC